MKGRRREEEGKGREGKEKGNSIEKVEKQLSELCDIFTSLEKRFKPTSLVKASVEAFHRTEWAENISKDMLETSARVHLEELVENLIEDKLQEKFEVKDSLLQTFISFLTFKQNSDQ